MNKQKSVKKTNLFIDIILYFTVLFHSVFFLIQNYDANGNPQIYAGFLLIGVISFYGIITSKRCITIKSFVCIFLYIFFFLAPWQQYTEGGKPIWHVRGLSIVYTDDLYLKANAVVIGTSLIFLVTYQLMQLSYKREKSKFCSLQKEIPTYLRIMLTALSALSLLFLICTNNLTGNHGEIVKNVNANWQIISMIRFAPGYALIIYGTYCKAQGNVIARIRSMLCYYEIIGILCIFLVIYNPLYGWPSRNMWLVPFTAMLALIFYDLIPKSISFAVYYYALVVLFTPLKGVTLSTIDLSDFINEVNLNYFDYDAYQLLMTIIAYTDRTNIVFGKNILSALAFLVPRSFWTGKMDATGALAVQYFGSDFTNVSAPFVAELYFAFGRLGCILGAILTAISIFYIDGWYQSQSILKRGIFCIIAGEIFFILRGALLPTLSFTLALVLPLLILHALIYFINAHK